MSFSSEPSALTNQLPISMDFPKDEEKFLEVLTAMYKRIANSVNSKTGGLYTISESFNSEQYFTKNDPQKLRNVYRKVIDFGALPNASSKSVAHGITGISSAYNFTRTYAEASDTTNLRYIPIPYASPILINAVEISVDSTNVTITTGSDRSNFNITLVTLEYVKNS